MQQKTFNWDTKSNSKQQQLLLQRCQISKMLKNQPESLFFLFFFYSCTSQKLITLPPCTRNPFGISTKPEKKQQQ